MENDLISRSALIAYVVNTPSKVCQDAPYDNVWFTRLVDREQEILDMVKNAPAVDAVKVVRCKDCKYYDYGKRFPDIKWCCRLKNGSGEVVRYNYADDDFCNYGERRGNDGK